MRGRIRSIGRLHCLAAATGACALAAACATPPTAPGLGSVPVPATPPDDLPVRKLPHSKLASTVDWYPAQAKRANLEGRILVEFNIDPSGRAHVLKLAAAQADPMLQAAAVELVRHVAFDISDPNLDAANPAPFRMSVTYCMFPCKDALVPYAGYENVTVTGYLVRRRP
jgi:TonB family protein